MEIIPCISVIQRDTTVTFPSTTEIASRLADLAFVTLCYNLINNFSIIACGARSCATAYLLTGAQHNISLRAGMVRVDR